MIVTLATVTADCLERNHRGGRSCVPRAADGLKSKRPGPCFASSLLGDCDGSPHPAGFDQLFLVVQGAGWVTASQGRQSVSTNVGALNRLIRSPEQSLRSRRCLSGL